MLHVLMTKLYIPLDTRSKNLIALFFFSVSFRDAPEATGDEPEDADFETPKVYELVQYEIIRDSVDLNENGREL